MNTVIAGLMALATLGGTAAVMAECADLAGQGHACATVDPASGAEVEVVLEPTPPADARAAHECVDAAGQATACHAIAVDPASGASVDVDVSVHPTPPVAAQAAHECVDLAGQGYACATADPASGAEVEVVLSPSPPLA